MHKNSIWLAFLAVVSVATLWFSFSALRSIQTYMALSETTPLVNGSWSTRETSGLYKPVTHFQYEVVGELFEGQAILTHPIARNTPAAEEMVHYLSRQKWIVWYDPNHPDRYTLEKALPIKECLSAITLLGVFTYLVWLGYSVGLKEQ